MKAKRILVLALVVVFAVAFTLGGCATTATPSTAASESGAATTDATAATDAPAATEAPATTVAEMPKVCSMFSVPDPENGGGWDRAQSAGLSVLKDEYGWELSVAEDVPYAKISETTLNYLDKGYNMVIFPDNGMIESWKELAPQYPDTWMVMTSLADELPDSPKSAAYAPDFFVYGNMVGIAMAKASATGKIGIVGGAPIPVLETLFSGIIEGAKYVNPNIAYTVYWAGDWVDTAKHKELALLQTNDGADVLFTVTGPGAKGIYDAAVEGGAKVIGYAWDLYNDNPQAFMTSLQIDFPALYMEVAENFVNGTMEHKIYDMGLKYFYFADFRGSVPAEVEKDILDTVQQLKDGSLTITKVLHPEIMS